MSRRHQPNGPIILPYREENTNVIKYASLPAPNLPNFYESPYDSDAEPLIPSTVPISSDLDEDALMRFTATGRPMPAFKPIPLQNIGHEMYTLPQLLPKRYTDDSIIPAIVTNVIPAPPSPPQASTSTSLSSTQRNKTTGNELSEGNPREKRSRTKSFIKKLKGKGTGKAEGENGLVKVVYMPRREYLKYFARGLKGEYIGSEPFRRWSEGELEQKFGRFRPEKKEEKKEKEEKRGWYRPAS